MPARVETISRWPGASAAPSLVGPAGNRLLLGPATGSLRPQIFQHAADLGYFVVVRLVA